jgi:hypothetical protein
LNYLNNSTCNIHCIQAAIYHKWSELSTTNATVATAHVSLIVCHIPVAILFSICQVERQACSYLVWVNNTSRKLLLYVRQSPSTVVTLKGKLLHSRTQKVENMLTNWHKKPPRSLLLHSSKFRKDLKQ